MKDPTMYRKFVAMLALGAILSLSFVPQAKAFTLVEVHYLPAIQLVGGQSAQLSVSNFSNAPVELSIHLLDSTGTLVKTTTLTLGGGKTHVLGYTNGDTTASYSAVVEVSAADSVASTFEVLSSNGQVAALSLPFINSTPASQYTPAVRLTAGQSGAATVTNISSSSQEISYQVINNAGSVVMSWDGPLISGQTMTWPFTNTGKTANGYRGVVTTQAEGAVTCSVMTVDADGHVKSFQWGVGLVTN
jgi:hypothetical protein